MLCERAQCAYPRNSGTFPIFIVFMRASGLRAPFIFIPIYSVAYSIYTRSCTLATHPFASRAHRDKRKSYFFITKTSTLTESISTQTDACPLGVGQSHIHPVASLSGFVLSPPP